MLRRTRVALLLTMWALLALALPAFAQPQEIPGELLIKYRPGARGAERASLRSQMGARPLAHFGFVNVDHVRVEGMTTAQAMAQFRNDPRIEYIEPNYVITADLIPNDPRFPELYGMQNTGQTGGTAGADIHAVNAWDVFTGDPNLKIGVIDTGIDYNHPDLAANVWTNPGEIPGNGVDDDGNGYIDDIHGYDFVNNDGDPMDDNGHGSHCAGTIAGVGNNNVGVAGVVWTGKVIGIKFLNAGGSGSTAGAIAGVQYAVAVGARLTSNSWGGGGFSQALLDAINTAGAAGQLFVAAAGNSSSNNDTSPHYPSSYDTPYILAVAATDHHDNLASFSSFGATSVDIAAPGVNILSLQPGGGYRLLSGTSMATPHVAGVVALAMGRFPAASNIQIKSLILNAAEPKPQLAGKVLTGGRLNAFLTIADPDETPPGLVSDLATENPSSNAVGLVWTATGDDGDVGRASSYEIRYSTAPITDLASFEAATLVPGGPNPQPFGSSETYEVTGLDFSTLYHFALRARDEFGNAGPVSNVATGTTLGVPDLAASPGSFASSLLTGATENQTLTLSNTAQGTLDFTIPTPQLQFAQPVLHEYIPHAKGDDWRIGDPVTDNTGGPDGFGYRWIDSDEPGGPVFGWVDITGVGTQLALTGDDAISGPVAMGLEFPFYGGSFNSVRIATNGFLSFTDGSTAFENQPLPNAGAPANLLAPFWDDLDFGATPRVYTHNDGSRFIVSWVGAPHYGGGGPYTFQAILYPSGEIRYQYLSLGAPVNSATAGIQNAAKNVGLNVAFNTTYFHDDLAVRILPLRQWLNVTPTSGRILAGQSMNLDVQFNALGLNGGTYDGTIQILSNDPDESPTGLPATLNVTGAPDIAVSPGSIAYGTLFVGATPSQNLTVSNPGTDLLTVSGITTGDPAVTVSPASFSVPAQGAQVVTVTWSPQATGVLATSVDIASDDPDQPLVSIPVSGEAVPAPSFTTTPESFSVALLTNTATSQTLRISNSGGSDYLFTAEAQEIVPTGTVTVHTNGDQVSTDKDAPDTEFGITPEGAGGPDGFGYSWSDSDEPGGPAFNWFDISAIGTPIALSTDDANAGPIPIGFDFPYYGNSFNSIRACTNGWLSFTSTRTNLGNVALPNNGSTIPENLLAVFWDDLHFRSVQRARWYNDGSRFIVQYTNVPRYATTPPSDLTFQVILYPNGTIVYQYLTMSGVLNSATIGLQNATKDDGLQVVYNAAYLHDNMAIRFQPPARFLTVSPESGAVPPGGFVDLNVGFDASGLFGGTYLGQIHIAGNDPILPEKDVPAELVVTGVPDVAVDPASLDFGNVFVGYPQLLQLSVQNVGTDVLSVSDIVMSNPAFGVDQATFNVPPLGNAVLFVSFNAPASGPHAGTATIQSNDPDTPSLVVDLAGMGLIAPDIATTPTAISQTLPIPGTASQTLRIDNTGGSDLSFQIGASLSSTQAVEAYEPIELGKEESDPRPGVLGSGGPDAFGYRWIDSDDPGGPAFDWVDITAIGVPVSLPGTGDDANATNIPIGFDFPFYGNTFGTVNVCSNGWLSFTNTTTDLSNDPLPNTAAPENLLAVFWDDLNPGTATPRIYRYSDGTRFIVSYVGVPRFSSGGPYTFQVILYASGRIVYQYLDMQGTRLNEATIGIQNAAEDDGLTIVHNSNYVHGGLAISIATTPEYMTVSPTTGVIPAGGFADVQVAFDTQGLFGGTYDGSLHISSNDPDEGALTVPTSLVAQGTPHVAAEPASLDFGPVYLSLSADLNVTIRNVGSDVLTVNGASIANPDYTIVSAPAFPIDLGQNGSFEMTLRFAPGAACDPCSGQLDVTSNDPDDPTLAVALTGIGVTPPEIGVDPTTVSAALATTLGPTAIMTTKKVVIENTGGSDLTYGAHAAVGAAALESQSYVELAKGVDEAGGEGEVDPRPGMLGTGGPDGFGYVWTDSDEAGGPVYDWVEISGIGTPVPFAAYSDDGNVGPIPIGFDFPFYGNTFGQLFACTNGWLSFTNSTLRVYSNQPLPNSGSGAPENLLAAWWDDMVYDESDGNSAWYYNDGSRLIVQYDVRRIAQGAPPYYKFQVILYPNGDIVFQYHTLGTTLNSSTIGIQNGTRDDGLTVVFNDGSYAHQNLAVRFSAAPQWLSVTPTSGTVPAGERDTLEVKFDATGLADGDYEGVVRITSNDLDEPATDVTALLHVGVEEAALALDPNTLHQSSSGRWVEGTVTVPSPYTPQMIRTSSVLLQRTVPVADDGPVGYSGQEAVFKFYRDLLMAVLPDGDSVPVEVIGEITDETWFHCWDEVRVLRPKQKLATGDIVDEQALMYTTDDKVLLQWEDPVGHPATSYDVWLTRDGGESWEQLATGITERQYLWRVSGEPTAAGMLEVVAVDGLGPMGALQTAPFVVIDRTASAEETVLPDRVALRFASANPARGMVRLELAMPTAGEVDVAVHDVRGAVVARIANGTFEAGRHTLLWDGRMNAGSTAGAGMYFVRGVAGGRTFTMRFALLR